MTGIVAATVANYSFSPPQKPKTPLAFMPSEMAKQAARRKRQPAPDRKAIALNIRAFLEARISQE